MSQPTSGRATPQAAPQASAQKLDKRPALAGAKTTQRKGVAKAQAKFEPSIFRDDLLRSLASVQRKDYEGYSRVLESLANDLDFRKYEAQLFELLILGHLLAPGGNLLVEGDECPISVLGTDVTEIREVVGVFERLIRRYKYLQRPLETSSLPLILQNSNRLDKQTGAGAATTLAVPGGNGDAQGSLTPGEGATSGTSTPITGTRTPLALPAHARPAVEKLAIFTAMMIATNQVNPTILASVKREHLVKDGSALVFLTAFLRSFVAPSSTGSGCGETVEALTSMLRKTGYTDLLEFFPLQKRSVSELQKEFKEKKVDTKVTEWYLKVVENWKKEEIIRKLQELTADSGQGRANNDELIAYLTTEARPSTTMADADFVTLLWQGLMSNVETDDEEKTDVQIRDAVLAWVKAISPVFAEFTKSARAQIALINAIQVYVYNNTKLTSSFARIIQILYNDDVLSSEAIFYWYEKGAKSQGKQTMLKNMEPLVKAIRESEDSDEEDDE